MSTEYLKLFSLPPNLYSQGSPVVILAGALHKNTLNNRVICQIKFQNLTTKNIKAIFVSLSGKDVQNREIETIKEFQYLDLSLTSYAIGCDRIPIIFSNSNVRSFSITNITVIFFNGEKWESTDNDWSSLPAQQSLDNYLNVDEKLEYCEQTSNKSWCLPLLYKDLWFCSCGLVNKNTSITCHNCKCEKSIIFNAVEKNSIHNHINEKQYALAISLIGNSNILDCKKAIDIFTSLGDFKNSKEMINECNKIVTQLEAKEQIIQEENRVKNEAKKKKRKKLILISSISILVVITIVLLTVFLIIPPAKYNESLSLINEGKYDEAATILCDLNFKDSNEIIENNFYNFSISTQVLLSNKYNKPVIMGEWHAAPLQWKVLSVNENEALLLTNQIIDYKGFDEGSYYANTFGTYHEYSNKWVNSTSRVWLNKDFINQAFSEKESSLLLSKKIITSYYNEKEEYIENITEDKVFLLSVDEVLQYLTDAKCDAPSYAKEIIDYSSKSIYTWWWTRDVDDDYSGTYHVNVGNYYITDSGDAHTGRSTYEYGIRPAMWISLPANNNN